MFCEVLLDSWTKEFYKREGKINMKRTEKKGLKGERDRRLEKKLGRGNLSGCSVNVFSYIYSYI
jgi:hypothetical protein